MPELKYADLDKPLIPKQENKVMEVFLRYAGIRPEPCYYRPPENKKVWDFNLPDKRNVNP